ncbi:hypothetical protein R1sor_024542 [Riccia sorocarpa]|uniref:Uncharacterized protein n=1 Tax=Riccia sorocarpa TaxID=122646 RepID=A0ABD3GSN6_9MARC
MQNSMHNRAESLSIPQSRPSSTDSPDSPSTPGQPSTPLHSDTERSCLEQLRDIGERANSGKWRKKDVNRASSAVVDEMEKFGESISAVEDRRDVREEKRDNREEQRIQRESEHMSFLEENMAATRQLEERQDTEMVDVFKTMAQAFLLMAQQK